MLLTVPHLKSNASPYNALMAIARHLPREEFHLTVCSLRNDGHHETIPVLRELGVPAFVSRMRPRGRRLRHIFASLRDQREIASRGPFDIQHSLDFTPSFIEGLFAKLAGRRFVFSQRNLNPRGSRRSLRAKIALARRIVANSDAVHQFLIAQGAAPGKITTIYVGLEESAQLKRPAVPGGELRLLAVGQLVGRKRHEDAIRALALLRDLPGLRLDIAGPVFDSTYRDRLEALVAELGLTNRVALLGPRDDVRELMQNAACLVLCSDSEAFANVLVEAMAAGLPVVSSAVDGSKEAVVDGETGFLVPVGDVEGYARAIRRILEDPALARRMGERALGVVAEKYSAPRMAAQVAAVYRAALD
ncbi:MAG: glycosyltransferase family 4 protein [Thermoanaerobaculia bacterium]